MHWMCKYVSNNISGSNGIHTWNISFAGVTDDGIYASTIPTVPYENANKVTPATLFHKVEHEWSYEFVVENILVPALCLFGIFGNVLTLLILIRRLHDGIECLEKAALLGMIMLAISDGMFCIVTILNTFLSVDELIFDQKTISLFFTMYGLYFQNIFIKLSTYITMIMAIFRYIAIARATSARHLLNHRNTLLAIFSSTFLWILFLLPLLWSWNLDKVKCETKTYFLLSAGSFEGSNSLAKSITVCWTFIGFLIPVVILAYCNANLILSVRSSIAKTSNSTNNTPGSSRSNRQAAQKRITITLISIVACFIILQSPSEIFHFYLELSSGRVESQLISVALVTCNVLQMINMSFNFLLYCIVNSYFRNTLRKYLPHKCQQDDILYNKLLLRNTILLEKYERSQMTPSRQNLTLEATSRTCVEFKSVSNINSPTESRNQLTQGDSNHLQVPKAL